MPILSSYSTFGVLLSTLTPVGCSVYQKYGYGMAVNSKLDPAEQALLDLPANAPPISQRFNLRVGPSNSGHRSFDILASTVTPVPCLGLDWQ